jgi:two-component system sensor histidine kinase KdpD
MDIRPSPTPPLAPELDRGRLLVCIGAGLGQTSLIHHAAKLAEQLRLPWTALHVETLQSLNQSDPVRERIAQYLRLAQELGAAAITWAGDDVAATIIAYAQSTVIVQIVIGSRRQALWDRFAHRRRDRLLAGELVKMTEKIAILLVPIAEQPERDQKNHERFSWNARHYIVLAATIAAITALGDSFRESLNLAAIAMMYMAVIIISAIRFGLPPSLFVSFLCILNYDFFFTEPFYHFSIASNRDIVAIIFFALSAFSTSHYAARSRTERQMAQRRAEIASGLYIFSRELSGIADRGQLVRACVATIAKLLHGRVIMMLPEDAGLALAASEPSMLDLDDRDRNHAQVAWRNGQGPSSWRGGRIDGKWLFLPMTSSKGIVGMLGLTRDTKAWYLSDEELRLGSALSDLAGLAVERVKLADEIDAARLLSATGKLRSALLTSLSHDLRTPLTSILGSLTTLQNLDDQIDPLSRKELLDTAVSETERLARFAHNILDDTRLEAGALVPRPSLVNLSDIVGTALRRAAKILQAHRIDIRLPPTLPMLNLDPVLIEQVLFNLFDNAVKYAPKGSTITIEGKSGGGWTSLSISDEGPGIPPSDLELIFDRFYRVQQQDHQRAGTGLGLTICRGFVEAHGGHITASNRSDHSGAIFTLAFPEPPLALSPAEQGGNDESL